MKRNLILAVCVLTFCIQTTAQSKPVVYNSLLWKISGKNLAHPSYLFGTMHLTDKRIFNFSDSLYRFLETAEGYAAELNMEESMPQIVNDFVSDESKTKLLVDIIPTGKLDEYKKDLEQKLELPLGQITVQQLKQYKDRLIGQVIKKGEMNTIIDYYLYDIARQQGKWVGGIEDLEDQNRSTLSKEDELMEWVRTVTAPSENSSKQIEWMIKTYNKQDLNAIDVTAGMWRGAASQILIRRNIKMARRIDSIMQLRTCFFAVGAAHLPGDSGLIQLLSARGYHLEPVYGTKIIAPADYVYAKKDIPWTPVSVKGNWYSLLMPGKSNELTLEEEMPFDMQMYFDFSKMNMYLSFGTNLPKNDKVSADSIYRTLAKNYAQKGKLLSEKSITINGKAGREILLHTEAMDMKIQSFVQPGAIIVNTMGSYKPDSLQGSDAQHYFESFHVIKDPPPPALATWKKTVFKSKAFSIQFPAHYFVVQRNKESDTAWKVIHYQSNISNQVADVSCNVMIMDAQPEYYSDSDTSYFHSAISGIFAKGKGEGLQYGFDTLNGFPAFHFSGTMLTEGGSFLINGRMVNRSNRRYYYYVVSVPGDSAISISNRFLNSFQLLPIPTQPWQYQLSASKDISLWAPSNIYFKDPNDSLNTERFLYMHDSSSPATILIQRIKISKYAWWKSDSSFFAQERDRFLSDKKDSLISYNLFNRAGIKGAELEIAQKYTHNIEKVVILINGDTIYNVFGFLPGAHLATDNYKKLFNEVKFTRDKPIDFHLSDKTSVILDALANGDSTEFEKASEAFKNAYFTKADLPLLQKALLLPYRDFSNYANGTHDAIISKILELDSGSSFGFVKDNYPLLKDSNEVLKYSFLSLLLGLRTSEAYDLFKEILQHAIPAQGNILMLRDNLNDSLQLTNRVFPALLPLSSDSNMARLIPLAAIPLLDSGLLQKNSIDPYKKYYYPQIGKFIAKTDPSQGGFVYTCNGYIKFLEHFDDPMAIELLQNFTSYNDLSIKNNAALAIIKNGKTVNGKVLTEIASDDAYRVVLYEGLERLGKTNLFPVKYKTQQYLSRSDLYNSLEEAYDSLEIQYVAEKTVLFKGKQQKFLLFKVIYLNADGESVSSLGITGPYAISGTALKSNAIIGGVYTDEPYDIKKNSQYLKAYLQEWEKMLKEQENETKTQ
jgi:uncharacterized protein YbaP (TraB family)